MPTSLRETLAAKVRELACPRGQPLPHHTAVLQKEAYRAGYANGCKYVQSVAAQLIAESPELAEAERLQAEVDSMYRLNEKVATVNQEQSAELTQLRAEAEALRVDKSRLDWLESRGTQEIECVADDTFTMDGGLSFHKSLRSAVDAASGSEPMPIWHKIRIKATNEVTDAYRDGSAWIDSDGVRWEADSVVDLGLVDWGSDG